MGIQILDKAIEFEKEGIEFYSKMLKIVEHEFCNGIIHLLLEEEKKHIEKLKNVYNELKEKDAWPENSSVEVEDKLKNIFKNASASLDKTLKPSTDQKEVLDLSMALELKGKKMYEELAEKTKDKKEKEFYITLSKEEEKHHQYLEQYCNYYWDSGLRMQE